MQPQILVVSDPPHSEIDHDAAAEVLGLTVDDATLKFTFPAPEVLSVSNVGRAAEIATSLIDAGVSVKVIDGDALVDVPWPSLVSSFSFDEDGLTAHVAGEPVQLPYDEPVFASFCKPPSGFRAPESSTDEVAVPATGGRTTSEAIEWMCTLDFYFRTDRHVRRVSIVQELADFSGLGDLMRGSAEESMSATLAECERRFSSLRLDSRMINVRPRQRFVLGEAGFDIDLRKAFSFGTLLLRQVLDSTSPQLRDLTQYELASRMAYVLSRAH